MKTEQDRLRRALKHLPFTPRSEQDPKCKQLNDFILKEWKRSKLTIKEIAAATDYSVKQVSRILKGDIQLSAEFSARVVRIFGYELHLRRHFPRSS